jgi:hypothetical protein
MILQKKTEELGEKPVPELLYELVKSCSFFEGLSAYKISWYRIDWWKFFIHLRSLEWLKLWD